MDFVVVKPEIGKLDPERGIFLGLYQGMLAYAAEDFLRDTRGKQMLLNFDKAYAALTESNNGRTYGDGTEVSLRQAIRDNLYQEGDLLLPAMEILHGMDAQGHTVRAQQNIYDLLKSGCFPKIQEAIGTGSWDHPWAMSGSEHTSFKALISYVALSDGYDDWVDKKLIRSGVVPVRLYRPETPPRH